MGAGFKPESVTPRTDLILGTPPDPQTGIVALYADSGDGNVKAKEPDGTIHDLFDRYTVSGADAQFQAQTTRLTNFLALTGGVDTLPYLSGTDTWATTAITSAGRSIISGATFSAIRGLLNIEDGADVTDEANVTTALDGATLPTATVAGTDKVLLQDVDGSDALKTATAQSIADLYSMLATAGNAGLMPAADKSKLDGIESGATADQTGAEIKTALFAEADTNNFDDAAQSKLAGIEASADVTDEASVISALDGAAIPTATVAGTDKVLIQDADDADNAKTVTAQAIADLGSGGISNVVEDTSPQLGGDLDTNSFNIQIDDAHGLQDNAGNELVFFTVAASAVNFVDIGNAATGAGPLIAAAGDDANVDLRLQSKGTGSIELEDDTNVAGALSTTGNVNGRDMSADGSKLDGIESNATADQTASEIESLYEGLADTNKYTDSEKSKLGGIEAGADVTDAANVNAAGALMHTDIGADGIFVRTGSETYAERTLQASTGLAWSNPDGVSGDPSIALDINALTAQGGPTGASDYVAIYDAGLGAHRKVLLDDLPSSGGGINSVVEDTTPQLGGDLDTNSFNIQFDTGHGLFDDSGNEFLVLTKTASAVNYAGLTNTATGTGPLLEAAGGDTNIDLRLGAKGSGQVKVLDALDVAGNITLTGTVDGRDLAADGSKLDGIESGATADQTNTEIRDAYEANADVNRFSDSDKSKLDGVEAGADVTDAANVQSAGALMDSELSDVSAVKAIDQGLTTQSAPSFTNVDLLDGGAFGGKNTLRAQSSSASTFVIDFPAKAGTVLLDVADDASPQLGGDLDTNGNNIQVDDAHGIFDDNNNELLIFQRVASAVNYAQISNSATGGDVLIEATGSDASVKLKLGAKSDTVEAQNDLHVLGNVSLTGTVDGRDVAADGTKLDGIESGATADQSDSEIKTAYENNADTNAFTDSEQSKLSGIESGADVTDEANVEAALDGASLTATTVADDDKVLLQDTSNSDQLRTATAQEIADTAELGSEAAKTGAYTVAEDDKRRVVILDFSSAADVTIPDNTFSAGESVVFLSIGSANPTIVGGAGMTVTPQNGKTAELDGRGAAAVIFTAAGACDVVGNLVDA